MTATGAGAIVPEYSLRSWPRSWQYWRKFAIDFLKLAMILRTWNFSPEAALRNLLFPVSISIWLLRWAAGRHLTSASIHRRAQPRLCSTPPHSLLSAFPQTAAVLLCGCAMPASRQNPSTESCPSVAQPRPGNVREAQRAPAGVPKLVLVILRFASRQGKDASPRRKNAWQSLVRKSAGSPPATVRDRHLLLAQRDRCARTKPAHVGAGAIRG